MAAGAGARGLCEPACFPCGTDASCDHTGVSASAFSPKPQPHPECQNRKPRGVLAAPKRGAMSKIKRRLGLRVYTEDGGGRCRVWRGASGRPCAPVWPGVPPTRRLQPGPRPRHTEQQGAGAPHCPSQGSPRHAGQGTSPGATAPCQVKAGQRTGKPDVRQAPHVTQITRQLGPWSR